VCTGLAVSVVVALTVGATQGAWVGVLSQVIPTR
jgi:hypothetical protein